MNISEIGNIIYLKETAQAGPNSKKVPEKKSRETGAEGSSPGESRSSRAAEVEKQNILASSVGIADFEEAMKVMNQLSKLIVDRNESLPAVHSGKPLDLSAF